MTLAGGVAAAALLALVAASAATPAAMRTATPVPTAVAPTPVVTEADLADLRGRGLAFPVPSVRWEDARDTFTDRRGAVPHEALDIPAERGAQAVAVEDGVVEKLFRSVPGGLTLYLFDRGRRFAYYYAHLDRYEPGLHEGQVVARGDVLGYVGSTGNASPEGPHLHFTIYKLDPSGSWWRGTALNPHPLLRPSTPDAAR